MLEDCSGGQIVENIKEVPVIHKEIVLDVDGKFSIKKKISLVQIKTEKLSVGGSEGDKNIASYQQKDGRVVTYLEKTPVTDKETGSVEQIVGAYHELRKRGLPVPPVVMLQEKEGVKQLVMTEMTENGKYYLWGYSDNETREQASEFKALGITKSDIQIIEGKVLEIARKATETNTSLEQHQFHIRKNKETGQFEIVLLDIDFQAVSKKEAEYSYEWKNQNVAKQFVEKITGTN